METLSDKILESSPKPARLSWLLTDDVKEFIKKLKSDVKKKCDYHGTPMVTEAIFFIINKLAGDKLI